MQIKTTMRYHLKSVRMSIIKKEHKEKMLVKMWRKENPCTLLIEIGTVTVEHSMKVSQKTKTGTST